jgi:hypothetical protein
MKDLSLHILDVVHNSIRAKATEIRIAITEDRESGDYVLVIGDDGTGIAPDVLPHVADPYTTSRKTRKVGMGLALLKQNAEQSGGEFSIHSTSGKGTEVTSSFGHQHIDRPPIGDISGVLIQLIAAFPKLRFLYSHKTATGEYLFDSFEVKEILGDVPVSNPEVRNYLEEMIDENLDEIGIER